VVTLLVPVMALVSFTAVRKTFGDLTALQWDAHGLTVAGMFNRRRVAWSSVRSVAAEQINTYAYGFLKVASRRILTIRLTEGPLFGKRLALSVDLLDLDGRTLEGLVLALTGAQLGRAPSSPVTAQRYEAEAPQPAPRYAPDHAAGRAAAAAPRYEARPAVPQPSAAYGAAPGRPTFGRRGA
ncbi:MAG: hypothetical protein ABIO37_20285, partial [Caulobacteraceae bacterium]